MIEKLLYQIHIVLPFFFPTLAMLCIKAVCKDLPIRAITISIIASVVSLAVFYILHLTLNARLPYVYPASKPDGQTGLGDGLIAMMAVFAYPIAVVVAGFTVCRNRQTNENKSTQQSNRSNPPPVSL